jgi:hypothetical protein
MNCTVCGNPLLFDRVVFHCSCGAYVHAYCWDEHVLRAHRPHFEMGRVTLDGEFIVRETAPQAQLAAAQVSAGPSSDEAEPEEDTAPVSE